MKTLSSQSQLHNLAASGHEIIRSAPSFARIAIPYLHFLNAHPNNVERYNALLNQQTTIKTKAYNIAARKILAARSLNARPFEFFGDQFPDSIDILFISHFLRPSDAFDEKDLYFGNCAQELEESGIKTFSALLNHAKVGWKQISSKWKSKTTPRALLPRSLNFSVEQAHAAVLKNEAKCLILNAQKTDDPFLRAFHEHAAIDAGSPASRTALRIARQIKILVERLNPKVLITTFEGHSWERLAYASAREVNPNICCIGYHHAVLFPLQFAMMSTLGKKFDPDVILTAGDVTCETFRSQSQYNATPIDILGSCRGSEGLEVSKVAQTKMNCLVLPEGIISESLELVNLAVQSAIRNPDVHFTIRLHPLISKEKLIASNKSLKKLPNNVSWSSRTLQEDCKQARWALYRGSSAIITAMLCGTQPMYFSQESLELSIDPVKTLQNWRVIVSNSEEVQKHFITDLKLNKNERNKCFQEAKKYCLRYFTSLKPDILLKYL